MSNVRQKKGENNSCKLIFLLIQELKITCNLASKGDNCIGEGKLECREFCGAELMLGTILRPWGNSYKSQLFLFQFGPSCGKIPSSGLIRDRETVRGAWPKRG